MRALWELPAPAKLNLFLHVIGQRADGYHLLQSAFLLIDWCDTLHFERRDDARLQRHDLSTPLPPDDLCLRAARALQTASGSRYGVDISIDKRLPSGAGMGGGSSDAATTLLALNRLWRLDWPRARLAQIALGLGADVPFFIGGENAWVEGIGERMTPIALPAALACRRQARRRGVDRSDIRQPAARRAIRSLLHSQAFLQVMQITSLPGTPLMSVPMHLLHSGATTFNRQPRPAVVKSRK